MNYPIPPLANDLLLRAVNRQPVPRVPAWLMRQAGRSDPQYRAYRERVGLGLYELFRSPEHAIPISLLPQRIGVDTIIMFQDILTPLTPMGADFAFNPGPVLAEPLRRAGQVKELRAYGVADELGFVGETISGLLRELGGALPLLGFAGAPFTLAAFMIEGRSPSEDMASVLAFAEEQPEAFAGLIDALTALTTDYLNYQIEAGVHAVQLFESIGERIPRPLYERYAQPSHERIFSALRSDVPSMLFVKGSPYPELMLVCGAAVLSIDERTPLSAVQAHGKVVQGNVDNRVLASGSREDVAEAVRACVAAGGGVGHILNLSHGILPRTPFENVQQFVSTAREIPFPVPK
ncbi:MAG: uroporphyrinogen decarboxylase [SAR324 cluster bacterium]|nr:uroporphyrinogen decarboxylase [SAR324 cluster bacterium]